MSDTAPAERVSLGALFSTFFVLGATSFGGGVVAYLREALVTTRRWLDDDEFLADLELSQTLPGLNATNMSIIVGDRLRGLAGATVAFLGMTLPGTVRHLHLERPVRRARAPPRRSTQSWPALPPQPSDCCSPSRCRSAASRLFK